MEQADKQDWPKLYGMLAHLCLRAERQALEEAGPEGLARASFSLSVKGLPPNMGSMVELWPGMRGRLMVWQQDKSSVQLVCKDVRLWLHNQAQQGMPHTELGVDPLRLLAELREAAPIPGGDG